MSGIVAIIHTDGSPVDRSLLGQMTDYMEFRGPDAQETWVNGHVGFGHTMLKTTFEAEREQQPCSLDDQVWITADCRVDGRKDLIHELKSRGRDVCELATDVELILHAYHTWDTDCVKHLIGDFSFVIWDGRKRRIFCARDHFGVKPLYFAQVGHKLIISNTLNTIRLHPEVSDELNDLAIADFLLFGYNQEPETTSFADIQRVPPAHTLTWTEGPARRERYWTLPIDGCIRYKKTQDYVEHFKTLFWQAVGDRLRTDKVGVFMSGGLDSTSIAAVAKDFLSKSGEPYDLRAHTVVYDNLIPDQERHFTKIAASSLGMPVRWVKCDEFELFEKWERKGSQKPEPFLEPTPEISRTLYENAAKCGSAVLSGLGADAILRGDNLYFLNLIAKGRPLKFVLDLAGYMGLVGRRPCLGVRGVIKRRANREIYSFAIPKWIKQEAAHGLTLDRRISQVATDTAEYHRCRPEAYKYTTSSFWPRIFELTDPGSTLEPCEPRYPFFDTRLVDCLMAMPSSFIFVDKGIVRIAMRSCLPRAIVLRNKMPLGYLGEPVLEQIKRGDITLRVADALDNRLSKYVNVEEALRCLKSSPSEHDLAPLQLNYWLRSLHPAALDKQEDYINAYT